MPPTATTTQSSDHPDLMQLTRSFEAQIDDVKPDERSIVAKINTWDVDRYQTAILPRGAILEGYRKNPVVLWEHGEDKLRGSLPVGRNQWITTDDRAMKAKTIFKDDEFSRELFKCYQEGWLRGWSVRMVNPEYSPPTPDEIRSRPELTSCRQVFRRWSLGEYSAVAVPGNEDTLTILASRGLMSPDRLRAMTDSGGGMAGGGAALKPSDAIPDKRFVKEIDGKWHVMSAEGKSLGEYDSKEGAEKRLGEIEHFKHEDKKKERTAPAIIEDGGTWWIDEGDRRSCSFSDPQTAEEYLALMVAAPKRRIEDEAAIVQSLGEIRRAKQEINEYVKQYVDLYARGHCGSAK